MTDTALTAARHARTATEHDFDEDYLRTWFTATLSGTVTAIPGGLRLDAFGIACPGRKPFAMALADWADFVLATQHHAPLSAFLHLLATRDQYARAALIEAAVVATGGTWVPPKLGDEWGGSHLYEIGLYGVLGRGSDPIDAARDWIKAATRVTRPAAA
jgi:hypothetical protein